MVHCDGGAGRLAQTVQTDVVPEVLQNRGVTVAEGEPLRVTAATDGDTGQPGATAQLQNPPAGQNRVRPDSDSGFYFPPRGSRPAGEHLPVLQNPLGQVESSLPGHQSSGSL